ncbi:hypothetical protein FJZ36_05405 [Candidatus Poribacteria bacterium]|nr:hypothetical protein [Candidatus Poribacteria bacterium]
MNQKRVLGEEHETDPFVDKVNRVLDFVKARIAAVAFLAAVIVVAVLAGAWYFEHNRTEDVQSFVQMHEAVEDFEKATEASSAAESADLDAVIQKLSQVKAPSSLARAQYYRARAALAKGDLDEAARVFREAAVPANGIYGLFSQIGLGGVLEEKKDWTGASQAYAESALNPFMSVAGFGVATAEAILGRARVARRMGKPDEARAAYESLIAKHVESRAAAIRQYADDLAGRASTFLARVESPSTATDLVGVGSALDAWVQETLAKPESERTRVEDAIRIQTEIENHLRSLAEATKADAEGRTEAALYGYVSAAGDRPISPSREQYQRASLEIERLSLSNAPAAARTSQ